MSSDARKPGFAGNSRTETDAPEDFWAELVGVRVKMLMDRAAPQQRRYKTLQEWTGVPSDRWSAVALGRQRPTAEMLGALCRRFNELTLWLMTGRDDPRNKQWNLETFFARKELRLSVILEKRPGSDLSHEELCVLASSRQLAKSLQDSERLECKRSANEIDRLLEEMPSDAADKQTTEIFALIAAPESPQGEATSQRKLKSDKPTPASAKKKTSAPRHDPKN